MMSAPVKRVFCDHCKQFVSRTVYYEHRRNENRQSWTNLFQFAPLESAAEPPAFEFSPECDRNQCHDPTDDAHDDHDYDTSLQGALVFRSYS